MTVRELLEMRVRGALDAGARAAGAPPHGAVRV